MKKRTVLVLLVLMSVAAAAAVFAAPRATLVLRNGDRIRCELIDLGGGGFAIRSGGAAQTVAAGDVALIDFTGGTPPQAELAKMQEGRPFIVLHNGDIIGGRLVDVGGNDPLRLTVRTADGDQEFSSGDVARIFLATWEGMPTASGSSSSRSQAQLEQGGAGMPVPARECWTDTGIRVERGQFVTFNGSGEIQLSDDANDVATVSGSKSGRYARNAPLPSVPAGALIGRIGQGRPFGIGDQRQALGMPGAGDLWLGINDDHCGDNRGEFRVQINARRR